MFATVASLVFLAACSSHVTAVTDLSYDDLMSAVLRCVDLRTILKTYECTSVAGGAEFQVPTHCKCLLTCIGKEMKMLTQEGGVDAAGALSVVDVAAGTDLLDVVDGWKACDAVAVNSTTGCEKGFETLMCLWGQETFVPRYSDDKNTRSFMKLVSQRGAVRSGGDYDSYDEMED